MARGNVLIGESAVKHVLDKVNENKDMKDVVHVWERLREDLHDVRTLYPDRDYVLVRFRSLADTLEVDPWRVSRALGWLERCGYIKRDGKANDSGRSKNIVRFRTDAEFGECAPEMPEALLREILSRNGSRATKKQKCEITRVTPKSSGPSKAGDGAQPGASEAGYNDRSPGLTESDIESLMRLNLPEAPAYKTPPAQAILKPIVEMVIAGLQSALSDAALTNEIRKDLLAKDEVIVKLEDQIHWLENDIEILKHEKGQVMKLMNTSEGEKNELLAMADIAGKSVRHAQTVAGELIHNLDERFGNLIPSTWDDKPQARTAEIILEMLDIDPPVLEDSIGFFKEKLTEIRNLRDG